MFHFSKLFSFLIIGIITSSCSNKEKVDALFFNGNIISTKDYIQKPTAFVLKNGKFLEIGIDKDILEKYEADSQTDLKNQFVYPGFYDAHAHFYGYAMGLLNIDLVGSKSVREVQERVISNFKSQNRTERDAWIQGRGWDQNLFPNKKYPNKYQLDSIFKNVPIILKRIDGHAAWCNSKALEIAGITSKTKISGGEILLENGNPSGILIDNAVDLVTKYIPAPNQSQIEMALLKAQENCLKVGLTTVADAGLEPDSIFSLMKLQKEGKLKIQIYAMASDSKNSFEKIIKKGFIESPRLVCRAVKIYGDGALGSRGACLLKEYADLTGHKGFLLSSPKYYDSIFPEIKKYKFQVCTHAIGDSANRYIIQLYNKYAPKSDKKDYRWRLEHAQIIDPVDLKKSKLADMIFSIQPTHATSDMYWAEKRLGKTRIKTGYCYNDMLDNGNGRIAIGSDFPVESINPLYGFYSAVFRQDSLGFPENGFQSENKLSRISTFLGMTGWAAGSCFQEKTKGQIEKGFQADFVISNIDLFNAKSKDIYKGKISSTYIRGKKVY